jgi:hypothetical protein
MFCTQDLGSHLVKQFTSDVQYHALLLESGLVAGKGVVAMMPLMMLTVAMMSLVMLTVAIMAVLTTTARSNQRSVFVYWEGAKRHQRPLATAADAHVILPVLLRCRCVCVCDTRSCAGCARWRTTKMPERVSSTVKSLVR